MRFIVFQLLLLALAHNALAITCDMTENNLTQVICSNDELKQLNNETKSKFLNILSYLNSENAKKDLKNSQAEWEQFISDATCELVGLYPECDVNKSKYSLAQLKKYYKERANFLDHYNADTLLYYSIWHKTVGTLSNLVFTGYTVCDSHTYGIKACGEFSNDENLGGYLRYNDKCFFRVYISESNDYSTFDANCISNDNNIVVHFSPNVDDKKIVEIIKNVNAVMSDLQIYANWYDNNIREKPSYKSVFGDYISSYDADHYKRWRKPDL